MTGCQMGALHAYECHTELYKWPCVLLMSWTIQNRKVCKKLCGRPPGAYILGHGSIVICSISKPCCSTSVMSCRRKVVSIAHLHMAPINDKSLAFPIISIFDSIFARAQQSITWQPGWQAAQPSWLWFIVGISILEPLEALESETFVPRPVMCAHLFLRLSYIILQDQEHQ